MNQTAMLVKQMKYECEAWKRSLEFMEFENNFLLQHLASLLKAEDDDSFVENAEFYQEGIIEENEMLKILRKQLGDLDNLLTLEQYEDGRLKTQVSRKYRLVKRNMTEMADRFNKFKNGFNSYVAKVL